MTKILIIDDVRCKPLMEQYLGPHGFVFDQVLDAAQAVSRIERFKPDLVLLDLHFPNDAVDANRTTGGRLYNDLLKRFPNLPVMIFSTRPADTAIPLEMLDPKPLASLAKPDFSQADWVEDFVLKLTQGLNVHRRTAEELGRDLGFVVGRTPAMLEFARRLEVAARTNDNLLLRGETGTGKALAAEAVHQLSERSGSFVTVRPASLPPQRVATDLKKCIAKAVGGTLCLMAEDLPEEAQTALLGLLDGASGDVRTVTLIGSGPAINAGLRSDLLTRLRGFELALPPLRERLDDIPEFFARTVEAFNAKNIRRSTVLRRETLSKLAAYDWPGNIRELEAVLRQALTFTRNDVLMPEDVDFDLPLLPPTIAPAAREVVSSHKSELAKAAAADIESTPQGNARYDAFKNVPRFLRQDVTALIGAQLTAQMRPDQRMKQSEFAIYFYGDETNETIIDKVRRFMSTNKCWGDTER